MALEREFSKAQRLRSSEAEVASPTPLDTSPEHQFATPQVVTRAWSPQGETVQVGRPRSSSPSCHQGHEAMFTPAVAGTSHMEQEERWSAEFQSFMHNAFRQFMSSKGQGSFYPPPPPSIPPSQMERSTAPGSGVSETSSHLGEEGSVDLEMADTPLSEDEEAAPEQASSSGLFDPSLFRSLLLKAVATVNLTLVQEEKPSTSTSQESNPLFAEKVVEDTQVPCPQVFRASVEKQWNALATPPSPNSSEKKLFNVSPSFASLLEVPSVDIPLTSLFSTSAIPGDMAEALKAEDKKFEHSFCRAHLASAWAIKAATSSSFFARASIMWLRELQVIVPPDQVRIHQTLGKLVTTSEYVADASLHSTRYSARSIAATVASRRLLWLKQWKTDLKSK